MIDNIIIIIPAYNPDITMVNFVNCLSKHFMKIIVVNDGSIREKEEIFNELGKNNQVTIYTHKINMGKGKSIKDAILYVKNNCVGFDGIITVDADGQHSIDDIINISNQNHNIDLILGVRDFSKNNENISSRSRFGNNLTSNIIDLLYHKKITDTQTGLRYLNKNFAYDCLEISGDRYEFEMEMLIMAIKNNKTILEIPIKNIYIDDNKSSHFNPIIDSIKIYNVIFHTFYKYVLISILSFLIDIILFVFINKIFSCINIKKSVFFATIIARIVSSLFNFFFNAKYVFLAKKSINSYFIKYYLLCFINMICSGLIVSLLTSLFVDKTAFIKMFVDFILFIINYFIQKNLIFCNKDVK